MDTLHGEKWMDGHMQWKEVDGWIDGWMDGWMD
jgi:hypothetical protein